MRLFLVMMELVYVLTTVKNHFDDDQSLETMSTVLSVLSRNPRMEFERVVSERHNAEVKSQMVYIYIHGKYVML